MMLSAFYEFEESMTFDITTKFQLHLTWNTGIMVVGDPPPPPPPPPVIKSPEKAWSR